MRVVDLTGPMRRGMWRYDGTFPEFDATPATSLDEVGYQVQRVTVSTHMGTHTDAPGHLIAGAPMVDTYPLEAFVGWATILDVAPCHALDAIDGARLAASGAEPRDGDVALVNTGWGARWERDDFGVDHPYLTADAAEWLLAHGVRCVGMDTAGLMDPRIDLGPGATDDAPIVDRLLLEAGVPYVAALCNLDSIRSRRPLFVAVPLKLVGLDGAPVRAVAIEGLGIEE